MGAMKVKSRSGAARFSTLMILLTTAPSPGADAPPSPSGEGKVTEPTGLNVEWLSGSPDHEFGEVPKMKIASPVSFRTSEA